MLIRLIQFNRSAARWLACALWLALVDSGCGETTTFEKGVAAYQAQDFPAAAKYFGDELKRVASAEAWRNLGNAEWQGGHPGPAVLAWERARWINPSDAEAAASLRYARQSAQLAELPLSWWENYSIWLSVNTWTWLATASFWLTVALVFVLPAILGRRRTAWNQFLAAVAFGVFLLAIAGAAGIQTRTAIGVILSPATPLRQTPTQHAQILTQLAAGELVRCRNIRGSYYFLHTSTGDWGWVEKGQLQFIARPE